MFSSSIDTLHRVAYRMAYPVWQFYLRQFQTRTQGAQVALWSNNRLLLIRNSYRSEYAFPGGYLKRAEDTARAARRELREETGLAVEIDQLAFSSAWTHTYGRSVGHDDLFECRLDKPPAINIDNREVIEARFVTRQEALTLPFETHVVQYLSERQRDH